MPRYSTFLLFLGVIHTQEVAPPDPRSVDKAQYTGILPTISVYNTTHAIIEYKKSFTFKEEDEEHYVRLIYGGYELKVIDNKVELDICKHYQTLTVRIYFARPISSPSLSSGPFQFDPINYSQYILDNTCVDGDLVLIDVENMIRSNDTFAHCHNWIRIMKPNKEGLGRLEQVGPLVNKTNTWINITVPKFQIQIQGEQHSFDVQKSSLKPCIQLAEEPDASEAQANVGLIVGGTVGSVVLVTIAAVAGVLCWRHHKSGGQEQKQQMQVQARTGLAGVPGDYYDSIESQEDRVNEYDDNGYMYQP